MSIQYSGSTLVNATYTSDGTLAGMQSWVTSQLQTAGWSVYSGSGSDITLMSAVTPQNLSIKFRFYNPGTGNCIQATMKSITPALVSAIGYLLPTSGVTYRIIANKYQFFIFASGTTYRRTARYILMGGVPWVPSGVAAVLGSLTEDGWFIYSGTSDTDTSTNRASFRNVVTGASTNAICSTTIWDGSVSNYSSDTSLSPQLEVRLSPYLSQYRLFADGSFKAFEAFIGWYVSAVNAGAVVGQLWDAIVVSSSFSGELIYSFDGHNYLAITDLSDTYAHSLFVAVT